MMVERLVAFVTNASPAIENSLMAGLLVFVAKDFLKERIPFLRKDFFTRLPTSITAAKIVFVILVCVMLFQSAVYSVGQYIAWQESGISKYLLPPHQPIKGFLNYVWQRFGKEPVAAFLLAGAVFFSIKLGNAFTGDRLFYDEEPYFAATGIMAAGWPSGMFVVGGALVLACALQMLFVMSRFFLQQPTGRFPLVYFWIPLAILAINFGAIIGQWLGLQQFKM